MRVSGLIPCVLLLCSQLFATAGVPIRLHPENARCFQWHGNPTVLVTSAEHYGALLNGEFDFEPYFDELAAHRLNHTRVFSGVYREVPGDFGITENTLAPRAGHYVCPWARSDTPGESDGGTKFDLNRWNPAYFERLRQLMTAAARRGIVVEFTLFCPMYKDTMWDACPLNARNNVNGIGDCGREEVYALQHDALTAVQLAFVEKVVRELRAFDNLYFEVCNEPYFGGVTGQWQHRVIDAIVAAESALPETERHLISLNIANGRKKVIDPHPAVSIFNFHYCVPPDVVAMNAHLRGVIGENETGFRGSADVLYRTEAWDFLLAGGGLFNNLDYSFTASHPAGTLRDHSSPGGGSRALRRQLRILREMLDDAGFVSMQPRPELLKILGPEPLTHSLLADPGRAYVASLHVPIPEKPKQLESLFTQTREAAVAVDMPAGNYHVQWIGTVNGHVNGAQVFRHEGGAAALRAPAFREDIALRIVALPEEAAEGSGQAEIGASTRRVAFTEVPGDSWRWVREDPAGWRVRAGGLELRAQKGRVWGGNGARNILLHSPDPAPRERAEVCVRLDLPTNLYEQGGLLRYVGDDDFVKLIVEHIDGRYFVVMAQEIDGKGKVHAKIEIPGPAARLAMQATDGQLHCHYWIPTLDAWADAGATTMPADDTARFGLFTQDGSDEESRWVRFEDFRIRRPGKTD